jgi:hypothetical protein
MKNIHILPTAKPSRLFFNNNKFSKKFELTKGKPFLNGFTNTQNQHIYITNDEEIKEGDWFIDDKYKQPIKYFVEGSLLISSKKIILTTDQDLINDDVQAIDDEFIQWFVKNPSCEKIGVTFECMKTRQCMCDSNARCLKPGYEIINPKRIS